MTPNCGKVSTMFPVHFVNYVPDRSHTTAFIVDRRHLVSARCDDDVPPRRWLGSLDVRLFEASIRERNHNFLRRTCCEDVRGIPHAVHPLLREKSYNHTATWREYAMDLSETRFQ